MVLRCLNARLRARWFSVLLAVPWLVFAACGFTAARGESIRSLQLEVHCPSGHADEIRSRLVEQLRRAHLQAVDGAAGADALLRVQANLWATGTVSVDPWSNGRVTNYAGYFSAELVDRQNRVLWSWLVTPSRFRTSTIASDLASQLVTRLAHAIDAGFAPDSGTAAVSGAAAVALRGAGSTLPAPLYQRWIESFAQEAPGTTIAYRGVGSEDGIAELKAGSVDFAGSDMPLSDTDAGSFLHLPTVMGGVVPIYNLPGVNRTLNLTGEVLAGIYSGQIRRWNDPRILKANRGTHLPDAEIGVVYRSDGSGTTFVWTSYLSLASPSWKYGAGAHAEWPVGKGAEGSEGVAQRVQQTPYSVGYVELIYAVQHELGYAAVGNAAGHFIKADLASIAAAASDAAAPRGNDFRLSILNAPGGNAYPISTITWLLIPEHA